MSRNSQLIAWSIVIIVVALHRALGGYLSETLHRLTLAVIILCTSVLVLATIVLRWRRNRKLQGREMFDKGKAAEQILEKFLRKR